MSTTIGEAVVKIKADIKELEKGLNQAQSVTEKKASSLGKALASGAAVTAAAIATTATTLVAGLSSKSVELYAAFEQSVGGTETLFKEASDTVLKNADAAFEKAAISANAYLEQVNSLAGALMQSTGGNAAEAAALADRAMQSIADNSAKIGTDVTMLQNAYQSLARGQFMLLDNLKLGYGGTRGEMERLIKDASKMTAEMDKLGVSVDADSMSFGNMVNAIAVVQEHMGIAGTTIAEAYDTISGSQKMAKASIEDFMRGLSDPNADLGALFDKMAKSFETYAKNLGKAILRVLPNIASMIGRVVKELANALPTIIQEVLPVVVDTIIDVADELTKSLPQIVDAFIKVALNIIIKVAQKLPEMMKSIVEAIMGIVNVLLQPENLLLLEQAFLELLLGITRAIPEVITAFVDALPTLLDTIIAVLTNPEALEMMLKAGLLLFMAIVDAIPQIFGALAEAWKKIFSKLWEITKNIFQDFAVNFGKGLANAIVNGLNKMLDFVESVINGPINAINGALDAINNIPGVSIQHINTIQFGRIPQLAMATGGYIKGPTTALVGEAGPEAVIPLTRDTGWAKALATALGQEFASEGFSGGQTVNVYMTNQINNKLDIDEVSRELVTSIRRAI